MESSVASSAMSLSLLARNVYCVCFADRDSLDILRGELAAARERYFTGGRKALRVGKREIVRGFEGKLQGKLSRRSFYWRKSAANVTGTGRLMLEEAFEQRGGYVLVNRDFRNVIASRVFFNKSLLWLKSEYYEPWDAHNPRVIFKPVDSDDQIERFDWDAAKKRYRSTLLYPVPYLEGTAEQSLLNARFGEPRLLVSTKEGVFSYCPRQEAQDRKKALEDLKTGTLVLLPAWEVKEGALTGEEEPDGPEITFSSLEEYARIQEPETAPLTEAPASRGGDSSAGGLGNSGGRPKGRPDGTGSRSGPGGPGHFAGGQKRRPAAGVQGCRGGTERRFLLFRGAAGGQTLGTGPHPTARRYDRL